MCNLAETNFLNQKCQIIISTTCKITHGLEEAMKDKTFIKYLLLLEIAKSWRDSSVVKSTC